MTKRNSTLPKAPELEPHHQLQCQIQDTNLIEAEPGKRNFGFFLFLNIETKDSAATIKLHGYDTIYTL